MLSALADASIDAVHQTHRKKGKKQGEAHEGWVDELLLDIDATADVVVHLFSPDQRDYYDLEELWQDGKVLLRVQ